MRKTLLNALLVLKMSLMTSCNLNPFAIDTRTAELVREKKGKEERISCYEEKAQKIMCFDREDLYTINNCLKKCKED
jgi:hypothetical protein